MAAQGHTTVDFGAFPGTAEARVTITGQGGIVSGSDVEAWIRCEASADHSSDEHAIEDFVVQAQDINAANGFLITARPRVGLCYGVFNVSWVWS
jgi:hypothetical protein